MKKYNNKFILSEENKKVLNFIEILLFIVVGVVAIYLLTGYFLAKDLKDDADTSKEVTINYDKTIIGRMFKENESDYYVVIYDTTADNNQYLSIILANFKSSENYTKLYTADLSDAINKKYYKPESVNQNAKNIGEIAVGDLTLIHFKNNSIVKYIEGIDAIEEELSE